MPLGHGENRHAVALFPHIGVGLHPLGDQQRRVARPRELVVPQRAHLRGGLEVVAVAVELEAVRVRQRLAGLHAQQRLVVVRGVAGDVVAVVGGQRRDVKLAADLEQTLTHPPFDVEAVVHQLEEVVVRPEDLSPSGGRLQRLAVVAEPQPRLHLAGRAAGGGDDARRVLGDELGVHPRPLAELTLERGQRRQLEQIAQPCRILGDHRQMGVGPAARDVVTFLARITPENALGVEAGTRSDIGLDADDRLDAEFGRLAVELAGAEHVSVIGHPDRGHLQALCLGEHRRDLRGTVQHRVFGVVVEVHEGGVHRVASL